MTLTWSPPKRPTFAAALTYRGGGDTAKKLEALLAAVEHEAAAVVENMKLSDVGKRAEFTTAILPKLSELNTEEKARRSTIERLQREHQARRQAAQPRPATREEQTLIFELARMCRESKESRDFALEVFRRRDPSPEDYALQVALCTTPAYLFGRDAAPIIESYQTVLRTRFEAEYFAQHADNTEEEVQRLTDEIEAIRATRAAILPSADREQLTRLGLVEKPVTEWTDDERRAFVAKHGIEEWSRRMLETTLDGYSRTADEQHSEMLTSAALDGEPAPDGVPESSK